MTSSFAAFNVDPERVSISGISAGAFMAHQLHIAYSELFRGAGLIAGGAYRVAQGSLMGALLCGMQGRGALSGEFLATAAQALALNGSIAPLENLRKSRVWVFHGAADTKVLEKSSEILVDFYRQFVDESAIAYVNDINVVHAMPTDRFGSGPLDHPRIPFMANCGYDAAGALLQHLHGPLAPRTDNLAGEWRLFDQNRFIPFATSHSLDNEGFLYLPSGALAGRPCGIHVVLHGCNQHRQAVGEVFVANAGYNEWAESNDIIVLYPQARPQVDFRVFNPFGAFDWWGAEDTQHALRHGRQMRAITNMVTALMK